MNKRLFNITAIVAIVVVIDSFVGMVMRPIVVYLPDANTETTNAKNALTGQSGEILILGSSRSNHHYVPSILQDSLGMSVFNGGMDGTDIIYQWAVFESALDVQKPKIVIMDINQQHFNGSFTSNLKKDKFMYGISRTYTEAFDSVEDINDKVKMLSNMYRFNSKLIWFITAYIQGEEGGSGYKPLLETGKNLKLTDAPDNTLFRMDPKCLVFLNNIVEKCKESGIQIVLCYSPSLWIYNDGFIDYMDEYCNKNDIILMNYGNYSSCVNHPDYFYDYVHMNSKGAEIFTQELTSDIKSLLNRRDCTKQ